MHGRRGITLVEVLIVVLVLVLLAFVVSPQLSRAETDTRLGSLKSSLLNVRAQLRLYRTQHDNTYPTLDAFVEQMTRRTDASGRTQGERTEQTGFGPYLPFVPVNPYTGGNSVGDGPFGTSDWYYEPQSGLFRANHDAAFAAF